jgi:hypothetical protein
MTRDQMIDRMVKQDIESVLYHDEDRTFINAILRGDGWMQYNNMTDKQIEAEYKEREFDDDDA